MPGSVTIFQPTLSCFRFAVLGEHATLLRIADAGRLPCRHGPSGTSLIAVTMRSLTSPDIAPLALSDQARSDCNPSRSACAIAFAVSSGFYGRTGTVVTSGLSPAVAGGVIWASADAVMAATITAGKAPIS